MSIFPEKYLFLGATLMIASLFIFRCNRGYTEYVDPMSRLLEHDSLTIVGQYQMESGFIAFCYMVDEKDSLQGEFVWNEMYSDKTPRLRPYFASELYAYTNYVSGRFKEGKLDGKILLMRIRSSSPALSDIDTIGFYTYQLGVLDGPFYLTNGISTRWKGTYKNGVLDGPFYEVEGLGTINNTNYGRYARWELNYNEGVYDSLQTLYLKDTIAEQASFTNGRLSRIVNGSSQKGFYRDGSGAMFYRMKNSSLFYSLIGKMLESDHTDRVRQKLFGDSIFSGEVKFCEGLVCNRQFTAERIINYNGRSSREETFTLENE